MPCGGARPRDGNDNATWAAATGFGGARPVGLARRPAETGAAAARPAPATWTRQRAHRLMLTSGLCVVHGRRDRNSEGVCRDARSLAPVFVRITLVPFMAAGPE